MKYIAGIFNINCQQAKMTLVDSAFKGWAAQAEGPSAAQQSPFSSLLMTGAEHGLNVTPGRIPSTAQPWAEDAVCFLDNA